MCSSDLIQVEGNSYIGFAEGTRTLKFVSIDYRKQNIWFDKNLSLNMPMLIVTSVLSAEKKMSIDVIHNAFPIRGQRGGIHLSKMFSNKTKQPLLNL